MALLAQADWEDRKPEIPDSKQLPDLGEAEAVLLELAGLFSGSPATPTARSWPAAADRWERKLSVSRPSTVRSWNRFPP